MNRKENWSIELSEYIKQGEPSRVEKAKVWGTAIGLQDVDGLKPSQYLIETAKENIEGKIDLKEAESIIHGATPLHGTRVEATDLRCGAALVVAGLIAQGRTEITNVYHIDRGYDNIDHKLITLGAHITRYHIDE